MYACMYMCICAHVYLSAATYICKTACMYACPHENSHLPLGCPVGGRRNSRFTSLANKRWSVYNPTAEVDRNTARLWPNRPRSFRQRVCVVATTGSRSARLEHPTPDDWLTDVAASPLSSTELSSLILAESGDTVQGNREKNKFRQTGW